MQPTILMLTNLQLVGLFVSWGLVVLIWIIQLVHYPSFRFIDSTKFTDFHRHHTRSITVIVMPLMLAELIISFLLGYQNGFRFLETTVLIMVIGIWLSTFLIQIPLHDRLSTGDNSKVVTKLVNTNWIRTFLWTIKAIILTWGYCGPHYY